MRTYTSINRIFLLLLFALLFLSSYAAAECTDTDPGNDIYVKGTITLADGTVYTDGCLTSSMGINVGQEVPRTPAEKVGDFFCDDGTVAASDDVSCSGTGACIRQVTCPGIGVCSDGACVAGEPYCTDTDGGRNYAVKGEVTSSSPLPNSPLNIDSCSYGSPGGDRLFEYYCEGATAPAGGGGESRMIHDSHAVAAGYVDAIWVDEYVCPVRCFDGACVDQACQAVAEPTCSQGNSPKKIMDSNGCTAYECVPTETLCADTDGGKNYASKGTVTYDRRSFTDNCSSDYMLTEFYCDGSIMRPEQYKCPSGCKDSVCVSVEEVIKQSCPDVSKVPVCPPPASITKIWDNSTGCLIRYDCVTSSTTLPNETTQPPSSSVEKEPKETKNLLNRIFDWLKKLFGKA